MSNIKVKAQYLKDFSFEVPNAPAIFKKNIAQSEIKISVDINANKVSDNNEYEVVLSIKAYAELSETKEKAFICECAYAGIFELVEIEENLLEQTLLIYCPNIIFPYVRRIMTHSTLDGGFPPLMIEPIDFYTLYENRKKTNEGEGEKQPEAPAE
ncbi:protein-export chaperone SecB [Rickettsiales bacterium]|nr:protein-export chaperone SecB [Rickettsiales bacterium]